METALKVLEVLAWWIWIDVGLAMLWAARPKIQFEGEDWNENVPVRPIFQ